MKVIKFDYQHSIDALRKLDYSLLTRSTDEYGTIRYGRFAWDAYGIIRGFFYRNRESIPEEPTDVSLEAFVKNPKLDQLISSAITYADNKSRICKCTTDEYEYCEFYPKIYWHFHQLFLTAYVDTRIFRNE